MADEKLNKLINKFELLFNINSQTPLFVTIAYKKILEDKLDEGLIIIENGLKDYPDHPTALLLKSKVLIKKGNYSQALKLIKTASNTIGNSKTFDYYFSELEMLSKNSVNIKSDDKRDSGIDLYTSELKTITDKQDEINLQAESLKSDKKMPTVSDIIDDSLIISDTLAKIYFNQKEYKEALRIYTKLKTKYPEKTEFYDSKIAEINALLDNSQNGL